MDIVEVHPYDFGVLLNLLPTDTVVRMIPDPEREGQQVAKIGATMYRHTISAKGLHPTGRYE